MKKIFSYIALATIITLSFIMSEKTTLVVKNMDEIMTELKRIEQQKQQIPENALIDKNTIIPGLNGKTIDIEKSYEQMKKIGTYNKKYLVYKEEPPTITIKNNYNKYIIQGNKAKNAISIIFLVYEKDNIEQIKQKLDKKNIKATFFIDGYWFENNKEEVNKLIEEGHTIGNLGYNNNYEIPENIWLNNTVKQKQETQYCYSEEENEQNLTTCAIQKNYTIKPNIIIKKEPLKELKQQITSGSLISMKVNKKNIEELELVIDYIKTKGYNIETIEKHLSEKNNN